MGLDRSGFDFGWSVMSSRLGRVGEEYLTDAVEGLVDLRRSVSALHEKRDELQAERQVRAEQAAREAETKRAALAPKAAASAPAADRSMVTATFRVYTVRGHQLESGIRFENGRVSVWIRNGQLTLAEGTVSEAGLATVVEFSPQKVVLAAGVGAPEADRELVLVQEYGRKVGARRWPAFHIDWDNAGDVTLLARAHGERETLSISWHPTVGPRTSRRGLLTGALGSIRRSAIGPASPRLRRASPRRSGRSQSRLRLRMRPRPRPPARRQSRTHFLRSVANSATRPRKAVAESNLFFIFLHSGCALVQKIERDPLDDQIGAL